MSGVVAATRSAQHGVLLPDRYCWIVLIAALDVMCTWIVLKLGGSEANAVAAMFLDWWGKWGLIGLKFVAIALVLVICEHIGRFNRRRAVQVADLAIILNATPVVAGLVQLAMAASLI